MQAQAHLTGVSPEEYVLRLIEYDTEISRNPSKTGYISPTAALFAHWAEEDRTHDPEEIARRESEGEDLIKAIAENPITFRRVDICEDDAQDRVA